MPRWNWHLKKCTPGNKKGAVGRLIVQRLNCAIGSGGKGLDPDSVKEDLKNWRMLKKWDQGWLSGLDGCMMGPFIKHRNSEEIKVRGEGSDKSIPDWLPLRCLCNIQSLGKRPALEMGFGNYQLQHNFHGNMKSVGTRKCSHHVQALSN